LIESPLLVSATISNHHDGHPAVLTEGHTSYALCDHHKCAQTCCIDVQKGRALVFAAAAVFAFVLLSAMLQAELHYQVCGHTTTTGDQLLAQQFHLQAPPGLATLQCSSRVYKVNENHNELLGVVGPQLQAVGGCTHGTQDTAPPYLNNLLRKETGVAFAFSWGLPAWEFPHSASLGGLSSCGTPIGCLVA
jgi:hypothetical protein